MKQLHCRNQQTIDRAVEVCGVGFITGADVTLRFVPAPAGTGVVFVRTDVKPELHIAARASHVTGTQRRTTLGTPPRCVTLVEHVLASLAGLRIDNCFVELDAAEPPGLDGSAGAFVRALHQAGRRVQAATKPVLAVDEPLVVRQPGAALAMHPPAASELRVSYFLDYGPKSPIATQRHTETITPEVFCGRLADGRTYLLEAEAHEMRRQGIGLRTRVTDLVVFGPRGPIDNRLRWADEPARHKVLDVLGDLALSGHDVRGHIIACRSGHPLNVELAKLLLRRIEAVGKSCKHAA